MFYELHHSANADYFRVESGEDFSFPAHIHSGFELITLQSGSMKIFLDGKKYILTPGRGILVFPNQIHAMETMRKSRHRLCIFSPKLVSSFSKARKGMTPEDALFEIPLSVTDQLFSLTDADNPHLIKGALYTVCGLLDKGATYRERSQMEDEVLLFEIFSFIEQHYARDCSLEALSTALSYSYAYLSKYFKRTVGQSYNSYVNRYRIREVCDRLRNTASSILQISEECGFRSLRSMNRNFKEQMGITPAEYRRYE